MTSNENNKYYVVEILDPLCEDFDSYFCIPASWIRMKESDQRVIISFPFEEASVTKQRVRNGEEFSENWTVLAADVKYGTDSYENANIYIATLKNRLLQEQSYAEIIKGKEHESSTSFEPKPSLFNRSIQLTESQQIVSERTLCANLNIAISEQQNETGEVNDSTKNKMETLPQSPRDAQSPSIGTIGQDMLANKHSEAISNDYENETESVNEKNPKNNYYYALSAEEIIKFIFESDFLEEFKQKHFSLEQDNFENVQFREDCASMSSIMKEIIQLLENYKKRYIDQSIVTNFEDVIALCEDKREKDKETINEDTKTNPRQEKQDSHDIDFVHDNINNDKTEENIQPKKLGYMGQFTLPREYNENDSRWTLRHPEKKPGLVELIPYSKVYVDDIGLRICLKKSNDVRTLARLLLVEIFSDNALRICSLTGKTAYPYKPEGYRPRPGLDEHARIVLFNYVEQYARQRNWPKLDDRYITCSVRNKLRDIRFKTTQVSRQCKNKYVCLKNQCTM